MTRKETHEQGKFKFSWKSYDVMRDFTADQLVGRTLDKNFLSQLLVVGAVIQPVIMTLWEGKEHLVDGRKRVLHSRKLVDEGHSDFRYITGKMFYDVNPVDQSTWALILNEQRSENVILTWITVRELQRQGKWAEIIELHKLNKAHFKRFDVLEKLNNPDLWLEAFTKGRITANHMLAIAKLGGRQPFVENLYQKQNKLSMSDIAEAKQISVSAAVATMPFSPGMPPTPQNGAVRKTIFVVIRSESLELCIINTDFAKALAVQRENSGAKIYRLVEV